MTPGQLIKSYRKKRGITQKELAYQVGYAIPQFISLVENGHAKLPLELMGKLVVTLDIPENKIIYVMTEIYKQELQREIRKAKK